MTSPAAQVADERLYWVKVTEVQADYDSRDGNTEKPYNTFGPMTRDAALRCFDANRWHAGNHWARVKMVEIPKNLARIFARGLARLSPDKD